MYRYRPGQHDRYRRTIKLEQAVGDRAAAPNVAASHLEWVCNRVPGPSNARCPESASGLPREQRQPLESPGNGAGTGHSQCLRLRNGKSKNRDFPAGIQHRAAIRVPPHAPSLLGSQPAQRGANAYPFLLPAYQKTSPQCFRTWVFERTQGIVVTWLPWGAGRGPRTSWIAGRKAQPAGRRVADCTRRGRGCTCAIDAREKSRRGGGTGQTP